MKILRRALKVTFLVLAFCRDLLVANALVAWEVVTPRHYMRPGIIAVPLRAKTDVEITLLANLITLTPGTLSIDVSDDRSTLFVHGLHITSPDSLRAQVRRLEDRVLGAMR